MENRNHCFKRILACLMVVVMTLSAVPMSGFVGLELPKWSEMFATKASAATSGYYTYTVSDGEATITDYSTSGRGSITIPSSLGGYPVTSIGYQAFYNCTGLTSITIPDSVTSIGNSAFRSCTGLTSITIPNSVTSIGSSAFYNCSGLTSITIPDSVTSMGDYVFYNCTSLTNVTIGNSVTSIGAEAFYNCTGLTRVNITDLVAWCKIEFSDFDANPLYYAKKLYINGNLATSISIPSSVTSIGSSAFVFCSGLTSITIPDSVTSIGGSAFAYCSGLTSITIPDSVTSIGSSAFSNCSGLTSITIPDSVTSIGNYAFYYCTSLTNVTIGNSVTSIGSSAFYNCWGLTSITIPDSVTSIGGSAFYNTAWYRAQPSGDVYAGKFYYKYKGSMPENTSVVVKDGTKGIADYAFSGCTGLTSITIPDSATSIGNYAFENCTGLTSLTIGNSVTSIGYEAFYNCTGLTSITIPDSATSIGNYAFKNCTGLTSLTIGNSVTSIGYQAFYNCTGLTEIQWNAENVSDFASDNNVFACAGTADRGIDLVFGDNVRHIPAYAFYSSASSEKCKLMYVTFGNGLESIGSSAFYGCVGRISNIPDSVVHVRSDAFKDTKWYEYQADGPVYFGKVLYAYKGTMPANTKLEIADGTKTISASVFSGKSNLVGISLPASVKTIEDNAFENCRNLSGVNLSQGLDRIGSSAFSGCSALRDITIPDSVTEIGSRAFYNCSKITSTKIPSGVTKINTGTFEGCTGLNSVTISDGVTEIGEKAFYGCSSLKKITIPGSVQTVGNSAFYGCSALLEAKLGNGVSAVDNDAFYNCTSLQSVIIPGSVKTIGSYAFQNCKTLSYVELENGVEGIGQNAFQSTAIRNIIIPDSVTTIGASAFENCSALTSVTLGNGITTVPGYTFKGSPNISTIKIGKNVTSIGANAISDITSLPEVYYAGSVSDWKNIAIDQSNDKLIWGNMHYNADISHTHTYTEVITRPSTCIETGTKTYTCECGKQYTENLPLTAHTPVADAAIDSTCTETGLTEGSHCSVCGTVLVKQETVPMKEHTPDSAVNENVSDATCQAEGTYDSVVYCSVCRKELSRESVRTDKLPHTVVIDKAVDSTCAKTGLTEGSHCSVCGTVLVKQETVPMKEHTPAPAVNENVSDATCQAEGSYDSVVYCSVCNTELSRETVRTDKLPHTVVTDKAVDSTCTKTGLTEGSHCSVCDTVLVAQQTVAKKAHTPASAVNENIKKSTCQSGGSYESVVYCSVCHNELSREKIETVKIAHTPVTDAAVAPTCAKTGLTEGSHCSVCGTVLVKQETVAKKAHTPSAAIKEDVKKSTCQAEGSFDSVVYCSVCNAELSRETIKTDKTPHTPVIDKAIVPTCTKTGLTEGKHCSVCGAVLVTQQTVAKKAHSPAAAVKENVKKSTCNANGSYDSVVYCSVCRREISRTTVKTDKLAHKAVIDKAVASTCTRTGKTEGSHCSVCGTVLVAQKTVAKKAHTLKTTVTKATTSKNGKAVSACTVCKGVAKTVVIPMASYMKLSATSYVYDGKEKVPAVMVKDSKGKTLKNGTDYTVKYSSGRKYVGTYAVAVTLKGNYSGSKTLSYYIVPKGTAIRSVSAQSAGFTAKWAKQTTQTTGYQIQYSLYSSFKSAKAITVKKNTATAQAVVNLKPNAKYYVRIRTYKTVGDRNYYSSWSAAKAVTTKPAIEVRIPTSATLYVGGAKTLSVKTYPTNVTVKWKSSNTSVAKVSSAGKVTAVKKGSAVITAYFTYGGKTYKCNCNVTVKNPSLLLSKTSVSVAQNASVTIKATAAPSNVTVKWKSSNTSVARVSSSGKITGIKKGTATVTAYFTYAGKTYSRTCKVSVVQDYKKDYVNIAARALILIQGQVMNPSSLRINNIFYRKDDRVIIWYSAANSFGGMIDYYACAYFNAEDSGIYRMDNCYQIQTPGGYVEVLMNYPGLSEYVGTVDVNEVLEKVEEIHQITFRG